MGINLNSLTDIKRHVYSQLVSCIRSLTRRTSHSDQIKPIEKSLLEVIKKFDISDPQVLSNMLNSVLIDPKVAEILYKYDLTNPEALERAINSSLYDPLTGANSRAALDDKLRQEISKAARDNRPISLILFDVDNFKGFNDTRGHLFGDQVIKEVISKVIASVRESDIVGKFGGDEYCIILPESSLTDAFEIAERIRKCISEHFIEDCGYKCSVTVSLGVASIKFESSIINSVEEAKSLFKRADDALYMAKRLGKNRVMLAQ